MYSKKSKSRAAKLLAILLVLSFVLSTCTVLASIVTAHAEETEDDNPTSVELSSLIAVSQEHLQDLADVLADEKKLAEYTATEQAVDLMKGYTLPLTLTYGNGYGEYSGVYWDTSDETVATVSGSGIVTARGIGKAAITAEKDGKITTIYVCVCESFRFNYSAVEATVGQMYEVNIGMGCSLNRYIYDIEWQGMDDGGKTVVVSGGLFQTQSTGTGKLKAIVRMNGTIIAQPECTFNSIPVAKSVHIGNACTTIEASTAPKMRVETLPANAEQHVRWESSAPDIASIDEDGQITVHADGKVTFTAYAQYWNGTAYADVVVGKSDKTTNRISQSFTAECWIKANRKYIITANPPEKCEYTIPLNAKQGETVTITTTRVVTEIDHGWEYVSVVGVYPMDSKKNPYQASPDPNDPTTFTFTMPDSEVNVNIVSATTHRILYTNEHRANFVRDNNLVGYIKIDEVIEGSFKGTYHFKVGDPAVTVKLGDVLCIGGEVVLNDDGTATVTFGEDSVGIDKELYFYADSQDIPNGSYILYVSGDISMRIPNVMYAVNNGYVLESDKLLAMSDVSRAAFGDTVTVTADDALLIYGTTYTYLRDNNLSLDIHFKDGSLKIPYTAISSVSTDENDYVRISFARTSSGSNNSTLGKYMLDAVKGTGTGEESDIKSSMRDCELAVTHNGDDKKLNLKTKSSTEKMTKNGAVFSIKLDSLGLVSTDGFEIVAAESPIKLGDILFYGGIVLLIAALGVAVYFLLKRYKKLQAEKKLKADEEKEKEPEEVIPDDSVEAAYTDTTLKTVNDLLMEAGLADEAEKIRQTNLAELTTVQTKGKALVVLANREITPVMNAAQADAELNNVPYDEGEVRKFLDEGEALLGLSRDISENCELDPQVLSNEELITFTDTLRDNISELNTRTEKYRDDYQTLSEWILNEKARREQEAQDALDRLIHKCEDAMDEAENHKIENDRVLKNITALRPTMNQFAGTPDDKDQSLQENLATLDISIETAYRKEESLAQEIAGMRMFVDLAKQINMSEGLEERNEALRKSLNDADTAVHDADDNFRTCSEINSRITIAVQARDNMEKAGLIAQIVAYVGISGNVMSEREERLKTVKDNCLDIYNDVPDGIVALYGEAAAKLESMKGDINEATGVSYEHASEFTMDILQTLSTRLKSDFDYNGTSELHNQAQAFINEKRHGEYTDAMAAFEAENAKLNQENQSLLTSHNAMLEAALAGLSVREPGDADATTETITALEGVLTREENEYAPNMKALTECKAADAEAQQYVDTLIAYTERIHQNAAQVRSFDYKTAGNKQLASITQMLQDDLNMVRAARHVITENATGLDPKRLSRKKLKYWQGQTNNPNDFIREYAKRKVAQHHDGVAISQQMRKLSKEEYKVILADAVSDDEDADVEE